MTVEEAIKILELNVICSPKATEFKEAVEVITNEINRQKAEIKKLKGIERIATKTIETQSAEIEDLKHSEEVLYRAKESLKEQTKGLEEEIERLKESQPKQAKWLINPDGYYPYCSECKEEPEGRKMTKFCPECGADMSKL